MVSLIYILKLQPNSFWICILDFYFLNLTLFCLFIGVCIHREALLYWFWVGVIQL